jgi:hypothetical protein
MKQMLLAALLMSAVSCALDEPNQEQRPVRTVVQIPAVHNEPGGDVQYMAFGNLEERALSDWVDSRTEAESKGREYISAHPELTYTILWRQKPGARLVPKHPRG